jgi:putative effector of murein hydrolase
VKSRDNRQMVGMMRDHWRWPWWVSTLIDVGVVVVALVALRRASRRYLRTAALLVALIGVVAAVMAPIVMTDKPNHMRTDTPMMP